MADEYEEGAAGAEDGEETPQEFQPLVHLSEIPTTTGEEEEDVLAKE